MLEYCRFAAFSSACIPVDAIVAAIHGGHLWLDLQPFVGLCCLLIQSQIT